MNLPIQNETTPETNSVLADLPPDLMKGTVAFVTGGGSGINFAVAEAFARTGAAVAICGRDADRLSSAGERLSTFGGPVETAVADVRNPDALSACLDTVRNRLGPVNTVVAGAAGNFFASAHDISPNGFRTVVDIDLMGSFHTARAAFDQLKETRGSLLFVSAGQAYLPFAYQAHVGAAKAGVENLMRNLAYEWGPFGIRSNSIVPGPVNGTEGMRRLTGPTGNDVWNASIPLRRFADTSEIASVAVLLSSRMFSYVTGAQIVVDGGLSLSGLGQISTALADSPHR